MTTRYVIESSKLVARDATTGDVLWANDFDGCPVIKLLPLSDGGDCLVLLDPGGSKQPTFENLFRVRADGHVVWRAGLPQGNDAYADVLLTEAGVEGGTWQGVRVLVELSNGSVEKIGFSK